MDNMKNNLETRKKNIKNYVFLHIIIFLLSLGGILSKTASTRDFLSFEFLFFYGLMIFNLGLYAVLWQQMIKRIPLTTAFCNKAVSIIWGMLWGILFFHEIITWNMILGAVIVIIGVILVVRSDG